MCIRDRPQMACPCQGLYYRSQCRPSCLSYSVPCYLLSDQKHFVATIAAIAVTMATNAPRGKTLALIFSDTVVLRLLYLMSHLLSGITRQAVGYGRSSCSVDKCKCLDTRTVYPTSSHRHKTRLGHAFQTHPTCLLYTSPSPRDRTRSRMPSSA